MVVSLFYIKLLDWFADELAYCTVVAIGLSQFVVGYLIYTKSVDIEALDPSSSSVSYYLWGAVALWISGAIYCLCLCCNWAQLKLSVMVIDVAADFVQDTRRIVIVPIAYFLVWCLCFWIWFYGFLGVASISESDITVSSVRAQSKEVNRSEATNWMLFGMCFGMLWITSFIMAANEFALIAATITWYFSDKSKDANSVGSIAGEADVSLGVKWTYRYQAGTIALGSFILAIIWVVRAIFEYIGEKMMDASGNNRATKCFISCMRCCLDCFDRFIRYLNRNAYIYSCITSESFCPSALQAFLLMLKNATKFGIVNTISTAFIYMAVGFVSVVTTLVGYFLLKWTQEVPVDTVAPCCLIFLIGYLVGTTFISPFDVGANTILQCYLIDKDVQKRCNTDSKHLPHQLEDLMQKLKLGDSAEGGKGEKLLPNDMN